MINQYEPDIRRFYEILGHENYGLTEVRVIHPLKGLMGIGFYDDKKRFVESCIGWNEKGNVYVGKNPRPFSFCEYKEAHNQISSRQRVGGKSRDVSWMTMLNLDIDPVREKGLASTDDELRRAIKAGTEITDDYEDSVLYSTGNGVGVLFPVKPFEVADCSMLEMKIKTWEQKFRSRVEVSGLLKLDSMYDLARIIKVAGTYSIKGDDSVERPFRVARILVDRKYSRALDEVLQVEVKPDDYLLGKRKIEFEDIPKVLPLRFSYLLEKISKLKRTWDGDRLDLKDQSRSGFDLALADLLAVYGFSDEEMVSILRNNPAGKGSKASKSYLELTIRKARSFAGSCKSAH